MGTNGRAGDLVDLLAAIDAFQPSDEAERDAKRLARVALGYLAKPVERFRTRPSALAAALAALNAPPERRSPTNALRVEIVHAVKYTMVQVKPEMDAGFAEWKALVSSFGDTAPPPADSGVELSDDDLGQPDITREDLLDWWPEDLRRELTKIHSRFEALTVEDIRGVITRQGDRKNASALSIAAELAWRAGIERKNNAPHETWRQASKRVVGIFKKAKVRKRGQ